MPRAKRASTRNINFRELDDQDEEEDVRMDEEDDGDDEFFAKSDNDDDFMRQQKPQTPRKAVSRLEGTPSTRVRQDKSARKKASELLLARMLDSRAGGEDDDLGDEDERIAEQIIQESRESLERSGTTPLKLEFNGFDQYDDTQAALFLDGPEGYFDQHKLREKISTTPFSKAPAIDYSKFVDSVAELEMVDKNKRDFLKSLYIPMFQQWKFELSQGFNLAFYGVGSKRKFLLEFIQKTADPNIPVLVVNGYNPATTAKEVVNAVVGVLVPDSVRGSFPKLPHELINSTERYLTETTQRTPNRVILLIHNLDGQGLRSDRQQAVLSRLAEFPELAIVASLDHIQAPVLFDAGALSQFNFLWHDVTTFDLYTAETSFDDPLSLGRNRSAVGSRGVKFVLSSLTANSRSLFQILVSHQLEVMTDELSASDTSRIGAPQFGMEFKQLYRKCVEEFIVSNEVNCRTMLTEFLEHKMAISSKDQTGAEIVYIPFTRDHLATILDDLVDLSMI